MRLRNYAIGSLSLIIAAAQLGNPARTQENQATELEYVGSKKCKFCHNKPHEGEQYTVWKSNRHSRAFEVLFSRESLKFARSRGLRTPPSESAACLKCHVTGYDLTTRTHPNQLAIEDGVQCESCHGPGSAHMADGKILRMNKDAVVDLSANIILAESSICVTCHNPESPPWDPEKYTLEDGKKTGFDFEQAVKIISHKNPNKARNE